jgi:hypothetical protein
MYPYKHVEVDGFFFFFERRYVFHSYHTAGIQDTYAHNQKGPEQTRGPTEMQKGPQNTKYYIEALGGPCITTAERRPSPAPPQQPPERGRAETSKPELDAAPSLQRAL